MTKVREIYKHIPEKDWDEVMGVFFTMNRFGSKSTEITREDLCVLLTIMRDVQNSANCGAYNKLSMNEIARVWNKIQSLYIS